MSQGPTTTTTTSAIRNITPTHAGFGQVHKPPASSVTISSSTTPYIPFHRRVDSQVYRSQSRALSAQAKSKSSEDGDLEDVEIGSTCSSSSSASSSSPERQQQQEESSPAKRRFEEGARLFVDLFQGKSEPLNWSRDDMVSTRDYNNVLDIPEASPTTTSSSSLGRSFSVRSTSTTKQRNNTGRLSSLFGFRRQLNSKPTEDELLNMDIDAVLSSSSSAAAAAAAASAEEQLNAVRSSAGTALRQLQTAYRQRTSDLHSILAEKNEKQEEVEETRTLTDNIKVQLDGMAEKVFQQEKALKVMADELEQERRDRRRVSTVESMPDLQQSSSSSSSSKRNGRKRSSNSTFTSDSGFESGDESNDSLFASSRRCCGGGGDDEPSVSVTLSSPNMPNEIPLLAPDCNSPTPNNQKRQSTYDKVVKASSNLASSFMTGSKCTVCHGVPASEAWTVLGILKEENCGLKGRLVQLETAVDDCLNVLDY